MKGYISIIIPTKPYIKAYLEKKFEGQIIIGPGNDNISDKLYDLLEHKTNERKTIFSTNVYKETIKVLISARVFRRKGHCLNETNIIRFNRFVELEIKDRFYFVMNFYCKMVPSFESNIDAVRDELGIDEEYWSNDSMKKDYYRHRKKKVGKLFYKK